MLACAELEREFVWHYLLCCSEGEPDPALAAQRAGFSSPIVQAHELIHRERVREAMKEVAQREFAGLIIPAVFAARRIIHNDKHPEHGAQLRATLSAFGLGERSTLDVNVAVTLSHTDAAIEDLRRLRALNVPRDELIKVFGYSGLERYERMLDELERRAAPKLIEGNAEGA